MAQSVFGEVKCVLVLFSAALLGAQLPAQQVRDSAGIRTIEYGRAAAPRERWSVDPRPVLEIGRGAQDGPSAFADIMGVARLSDGRIAVANMNPSEIRLFDAAGTFLSSLGRAGQGPGEFSSVLFRLVRSADTLIGVDNSGRAQVFAPNGKLSRSLMRARPPSSGGNPIRLALTPRGEALVQSLDLSPAGTSEAEPTTSLWREAVTGDQYAHLLRLPAYTPLPERGRAPRWLVYGPRGLVVSDGTSICSAFTSVYAIACQTGTKRISIRRATQSRRLSDDEREIFGEALLAANKGTAPAVIKSLEESIRLTQFASHAPPIGRLLLAESGHLWVSEFDPSETSIGPPVYRRPRKPQRWDVFDSDGTWRAAIELPARFMLFEAAFDYVIGSTLGEDDIEHVTVYRLRR